MKGLFMNVGRTFAQNGFVTVNISYRLSALKKILSDLFNFIFCVFIFFLVLFII
jgi:hypothetical protein